jgi:hypothetical protein
MRSLGEGQKLPYNLIISYYDIDAQSLKSGRSVDLTTEAQRHGENIQERSP